VSTIRHGSALHEAGHAVLLHHHWRDLPEEHRRVEGPFLQVEVNRRWWGGGRVYGCNNTLLALSRWQNLHIGLAGPMAQDGAATSRRILDSPEQWDIDKHTPWEKNGGSDFEKVKKFLDDNGMPDSVLTIAVRETAEILWANRRIVHEVARRAYKVGDLGFWALVDIWPDMADAVAEHKRWAAGIRVRYVAALIEYHLDVPVDGSTKPLRARPGVYLSRGVALYQDFGCWILAIRTDQLYAWAQNQAPPVSYAGEFAAVMAPHPADLGGVTPPGQPPGSWIGMRVTMDIALHREPPEARPERVQ
jgi:hypothetical protein